MPTQTPTQTPVIPTITATATRTATIGDLDQHRYGTASVTQTPTPKATQTPTGVNVGGLRATSFQTGTQIQWQAGYQPSNLGFRIYREVNGVKVLITPI